MAVGGQITPVPGYPQPFGSKLKMLFDRTGPTSYANIGSSSGGGDVLHNTDLGIGGFETCSVQWQGFSASGNYLVRVYTGTSTTSITNSAPFSGQAVQSVVLVWYTASTAFVAGTAEVANATNLSGESIRIDATCV
jgi:hypothetical protein